MNDQKTKLSKKKILLIAVSIAIVITVIIIACYKPPLIDNIEYSDKQDYMYKTKDEVYEFFSTAIENNYDISKHDNVVDKFLSEFDTGYGEIDTFESVVTSAKPLPKKAQKYIDESNEMIIEYFEENYNISVEDKMSELKTMASNFKEFGGTGAYPSEGEFGTDKKTVFLSKDLMKFAKGDGTVLKATYIHEVMHYLGAVVADTEKGLGDSNIWIYFSDGVAEALTSEILASNENPAARPNKYVTENSYYNAPLLVMQLYTANEELIPLLFDRDDFITAEEIESYFDTDSSAITAEEIAWATTISETGNEDAYISAQYYISEYCKSAELSKEVQIEIANYFIVEFTEYLD